ncbi:hypothetical protein Golob_014621, partial [Gossypium lobatum]|nr:hypothetical protein [Gossypium lobatum]
ENNAVIPLIQEFYATLKDEDTRRPYSVRRNTITVKVCGTQPKTDYGLKLKKKGKDGCASRTQKKIYDKSSEAKIDGMIQ